MTRVVVLAVLLSVLAVACGSGSSATATTSGVAGAQKTVRKGTDWTRFGFDAARHDVGPAQTGITAKNASSLRRQQVRLPGTVDSSPIYLHDVAVAGKTRDVFVVTTTYGRTIAVDAASGKPVWTFTPPGYDSWAGSYRITNASPVADPDRKHVYAAAPDGRIRKLALANGHVVWARAITKLPEREKLTGSLNLDRDRVVAATGGYIGDQPPYQGHVVLLDAASGKISSVWNSLCSDRSGLIAPSSCPQTMSAIWARSGVVVEPGSHRLLAATGNGTYDGHTNWGDSVVVLDPNAGKLLRHWTPSNYQELQAGDVDLGSTAPALLSGGYAVQGGKDGKLRLLRLSKLPTGSATGGELQTVPTPGGAMLFSAPAVWKGTWVFVATDSGTEAWRLRGGKLHEAWSNGTGGTSPVVAGGLLWVYDPGGSLVVYRPESGERVASLPVGSGHWQSPIVADGRVALPEGNANDHETTGVLDLYRLP